MYASTEQRSRERVHVLAAELYREHRGRLLSIARRNTANAEDAAEAVNFAFLKFIQKFDPESGAPPLAWLSLVIQREYWAKRRREHLDRRVGQEAVADSEEPGFSIDGIAAEGAGTKEAIERAEWIVDARRRLAALKPAERRALVLIAAGYSYAEFAKINRWTATYADLRVMPTWSRKAALQAEIALRRSA